MSGVGRSFALNTPSRYNRKIPSPDRLKPTFASVQTDLPNLLTTALAQLDYGQQPATLYDPIRYIMSLGGKRLRPLLTLLGGQLFTDDLEPLVKPALATETAAEVCEGQQWDMDFETEAGVTIPQYLDMIRLKTAVLLGFALELGAVLAGASADDAEHLRQFGTDIGLAFQLRDDLLDVYGD
nr:hypothetical protein [Tanacetum cinerariifolium]